MIGYVEPLEPRRLFAAQAVIATLTPQGVLLVTGTNRAETIAVVAHFPGLQLFDVFVNGSMIAQLGGNAVRIEGRGGNDALSATPGSLAAALFGGEGNDTLRGGAGPAELDGGAGDDSLEGLDANDILRGGPGRDRLTGSGGDDFLDAGAGNDVLTGGDGADVLLGGGGRDVLDAGPGDDTLSGGPNRRDSITGGAGADLFALVDRPSEAQDFLIGEDRRSSPAA